MPSIDELIAAERRSMTPPPATAARNREAIAAALARSTPPHAARTGWRRPSWTVWTLPVLLALGVHSAEPRAAPQRASEPASEPSPVASVEVETPAPVVAIAPTRQTDTLPTTDTSEPPAPATQTSEPPATERPRHGRPSKRSPKPPGPTTDTFGEELELLVAAKSAIDEGDLGRARQMLKRHRSRYPEGVFADEASAMRVVVRCLAPKTSASERKLARTRYLERHPSSPFAGRVREACQGDVK